jgi:hypothetical protein
VSRKEQVIRYCKSVFARNLYHTDVTNSILELRLALCCPVLGDMKSSFFTVADFLSHRAGTLLIFMQVSFCMCCSADTRTTTSGCAL